MNISVVIPVFNSQATLPELIRRLYPVLEQLANQYELILINDNSQDRSWETICELIEQYPWISGIDLMRNFGQHNALLAGIRLANYELIVTLDDDLQNPPEEIPHLVAELGKGYDVVYGKPQVKQHGLFRNLASRVTKLALQSTMGAETARNVSAFRAFRTQLRRGFEHYRGPFVSIDVLLTWGTTRFSAVSVRHDPRPAGASNYNFLKLFTHAVNMMTGFSTLPLQFASLIGFFFTLFGIGVMVFVLARYLMAGSTVPGFPFLASIIAIFSGSQLLALGIIGEYLARIHFRSMDRPPYVIKSQLLKSDLQRKDG